MNINVVFVTKQPALANRKYPNIICQCETTISMEFPFDVWNGWSLRSNGFWAVVWDFKKVAKFSLFSPETFCTKEKIMLGHSLRVLIKAVITHSFVMPSCLPDWCLLALVQQLLTQQHIHASNRWGLLRCDHVKK